MSFESHRVKDQAQKILSHGHFTHNSDWDRGAGLVHNRLLTASGHAATAAWGARGNRLYKPTHGVGAGMAFAGVSDQAILANPSGRSINLCLPGSICEIALGANVTAGDIVGCSVNEADGGRFTNNPMIVGPGAAMVLQTVSDAVLESSMTGANASITSAGNVLNDTDADFSTAGVKAGDRVFVVGIENDGTVNGVDADGDTVNARETTVSAVDSSTSITLTDVITNKGGTAVCSYYIVRGNPTAQALLLGPVNSAEYWPSGMCEMLMPGTVGHAADDNFAVLQGMNVFLLGGDTISTGNARETISSGKFVGEQVFVKALGAPATNNFEIKLPASGKQFDHSTALTDFELTDANGWALLEWSGRLWVERDHSASGSTMNSS